MHMSNAAYSPTMATTYFVGGVLGGVGGGFLADKLAPSGRRYLLPTLGGILGAPCIAISLLAEDSNTSFAALLVGYGLCEMWRAPSSVMLREATPEGLASTATAVYIGVRNMIGGLGPVAVAILSEKVGLRHAMLLAPCFFLLSGLCFAGSEVVARRERIARA